MSPWRTFVLRPSLALSSYMPTIPNKISSHTLLMRSCQMHPEPPQSPPLWESHGVCPMKSLVHCCLSFTCVWHCRWLTGKHAWDLQVSIIYYTLMYIHFLKERTAWRGNTFGHHLVIRQNKYLHNVWEPHTHPLLLSLANITTEIHSKGFLHTHLLPHSSRAILHPQEILCSVSSFQPIIPLLSRFGNWALQDCCSHWCYSMMNDSCGNLQYCYMPLVGYIADMPE